MSDSLLFKSSIEVTPNIEIVIPTVGQVIDHEEEYYGAVQLITATPTDMMVELDDLGIDFTSLTDYELFMLMSDALKEVDTSLVFKNLDLHNFKKMINPDTSQTMLWNPDTDTRIDEATYGKICFYLRMINHFERNSKRPANDDAKKFMIDRMRIKRRRKKRNIGATQLEELIVAMVNANEFKYKFNEVRDLTIYQFNESVLQVVKRVDFDNKMHGVYVGTINTNDLSPDDLNWLTHKNNN